jgi:hypothetical protein
LNKCNNCDCVGAIYIATFDVPLCTACTLNMMLCIAKEACLTTDDMGALLVVYSKERLKTQRKEV